MASRVPATPSHPIHHPLHVLGRELHSRSGATPRGEASADTERARRGSGPSFDSSIDMRPEEPELLARQRLARGQRGRGALLAVVDAAEPELEQRCLPPDEASPILAAALQRVVFRPSSAADMSTRDPWEGSEDLAKRDLADFLGDARTTASSGHDPLHRSRAAHASKAAAWECSTRLVEGGSGQAAPLHAVHGESVGQSSTASGRSSDSQFWYSEASSALPESLRPSIEAATYLPFDSASRAGPAQMRHLPPAIRRQLLDTVRLELSRTEAAPAAVGEEEEDKSGACSTQ